jgi:NhaA family Na+:H+ antiporter
MAKIHEEKAAEHRRIAREQAAARHGLTEVPGGAGEDDDRPA